MKKTLKVAIAASVLAVPAMGASMNMENPLYLPNQGQVYSKTSAGLMIKKADSTDAMVTKNHDGEIEFPIYRIHEELGYGITDRIAVHGSFGYTHDGDIDRKGMHLGRIGATFRIMQENTAVWDVYADAHVGGVNKMTGSYKMHGTEGAFTYDNYTNGRWGFHVGTKMGNTWGKLTGAMFAEFLQTFGNDNNEIDVTGMTIAAAGGIPITALGMPGKIAVTLKSATEFNAGVKAFYEFNDAWSLGGGITYKHHAANGVKNLSTKLPAAADPALEAMIIPAFLAQLKNMEDGFDEYTFTVSVANQLTDSMQVALYGEYTVDTAERLSQNGTDMKAEVGLRLNVRF